MKVNIFDQDGKKYKVDSSLIKSPLLIKMLEKDGHIKLDFSGKAIQPYIQFLHKGYIITDDLSQDDLQELYALADYVLDDDFIYYLSMRDNVTSSSKILGYNSTNPFFNLPPKVKTTEEEEIRMKYYLLYLKELYGDKSEEGFMKVLKPRIKQELKNMLNTAYNNNKITENERRYFDLNEHFIMPTLEEFLSKDYIMNTTKEMINKAKDTYYKMMIDNLKRELNNSKAPQNLKDRIIKYIDDGRITKEQFKMIEDWETREALQSIKNSL